MDVSRMKLSILMPVFNEKYTVEDIVDSVLNASLPAGVERELVIVDDQSTDGRWDILEALQERHPPVRLFRHPRNMGKGAAVRTAVQMAEGDVIVIQDADLEYDPADYSRLLEPILRGDADVVYGSRFLTRGYKRVLYFWHSLGNRFLTTISNMCTDLDLTDMETCFKMARGLVNLKRKTFSKIQLKIFDSMVWIWRVIDKVFPWRGISLVAIARKP